MDPGCAKAFVAIATAAITTRGAGEEAALLWTASSDFESNRGVPFLYDALASNFLAAAGLNDSGLATKLALVTNGDGVKVFPRADSNKGLLLHLLRSRGGHRCRCRQHRHQQARLCAVRPCVD